MQTSNESPNAFGVLVVTGGSSGIGNEFIRQYLKHNPEIQVFNLSRSKPEFSGEIYRVTHIPADFSDRGSLGEAAKSLVSALEGTSGRILLLNNSGFGSFGVVDPGDVDRDLAMIEVNVCAPVFLTAKLWPQMSVRGGMIVNVASTAAFQPTPMFANYGATKAFLTSWSLALWRENLGSGIHVLTVCPGPTSTSFFRNAGFRERPKVGRGMGPEQVVSDMIRAVKGRKVLLICGWKNRLIASFAMLLPRTWVTRLTYRLVKQFNLEKLK